MPSKTKDTPEPESHLDQPAGETVAAPVTETVPDAPQDETPQTTQDWPEVTERRELIVAFSDERKAEMADEMARKIRERERTRIEKQNSAKRHQSEIDDIGEELAGLAADLNAGGEERTVACRWQFEASGRSKTDGKLIFHPNQKTLIREDNGAVVEIAAITPEDRQLNLNLTPEEREAAASEYEAPEESDQLVDPYDAALHYFKIHGWEFIESPEGGVFQMACNNVGQLPSVFALTATERKAAIDEGYAIVAECVGSGNEEEEKLPFETTEKA